MRGAASGENTGCGAAPPARLALTLCVSLCAVGCASPRQAVGVGLIVVGAVAAAAGAATDVFDENPDPSQPASARTCHDVCVRGNDSAVDALLVAGGAAAVAAGQALANTPTKAPATASSTRTSPAAPAPQPLYAPTPAVPAAGGAAQPQAPVVAPAAPSVTRCLGPLREPVPPGCTP